MKSHVKSKKSGKDLKRNKQTSENSKIRNYECVVDSSVEFHSTIHSICNYPNIVGICMRPKNDNIKLLITYHKNHMMIEIN